MDTRLPPLRDLVGTPSDTPPPHPPAYDAADFQLEYTGMRRALMEAKDEISRALSACEADPAFGYDPDYVDRKLKATRSFLDLACIKHTLCLHSTDLIVEQELDDSASRDPFIPGKEPFATFNRNGGDS